MKSKLPPVVVLLTVAWMFGCEPASEVSNNSPAAPPPPPPPAGEVAAANSVDEQQQPKGEVAKSGFGAKGHYESNDLLSVTVSARFRAEERLLLGKITHGLQLYKATHGDYPDTHEEFWKEIIEKNFIAMPKLKPGEEYRYDPELARETHGEDSLRIVPPQ